MTSPAGPDIVPMLPITIAEVSCGPPAGVDGVAGSGVDAPGAGVAGGCCSALGRALAARSEPSEPHAPTSNPSVAMRTRVRAVFLGTGPPSAASPQSTASPWRDSPFQ